MRAEPDEAGRSQRIGCVGMSNLAEGLEGGMAKFPLIRTQSPKNNFRGSGGAAEGRKGAMHTRPPKREGLTFCSEGRLLSALLPGEESGVEDKDDKKSKNETTGTPGTASPLGMSPCFLAQWLGGCPGGGEPRFEEQALRDGFA